MDVNVISFPNLNLHLTVNRVAFTLFGKPVYWYGIIIAVGFVLGVLYAFWRARKEGLPSDTVFDLVLWGLPTCIICARIFYVIGDPSVLAGGFWKIIAVWEGGIAIYGAMIGAVIVGVTYCKVKKLNMGT
ncbi:MAG TPA: prolipoprotein diacylglyceryl transferase, partial [Candidatus Aphodoplasma excrementigallinarum]|nr:prolipoprotein diacylglyceryl transferase [Candidatus Aphodoplasma excrementigallinarum]